MPSKTRVFQLIDFDRTLFDTTTLIRAIIETIHAQHPEIARELEAQAEASYAEERTFFLLRYLREKWGDEWLEDLVKTIVEERGSADFVLPGAKERLEKADELTTHRPSWGIFTFGDPVDQLLKIRLAGLEEVPLLIASEVNKGRLIQSWQQADGGFVLPNEYGGGVVDTLTFEDDKLSAFVGTPENLMGVWVTQREDAKQHLKESGLQNVVIVPDLHKSLTYLRKNLS